MKRLYFACLLVTSVVVTSAYAQDNLPISAQTAINDQSNNLSLSATEPTEDGIFFEVFSDMRVRLSRWEVKQVYWISEDGQDCRLVSNLRRSPLGAWQVFDALDHCPQFTIAEVVESAEGGD
jgi:hypothetical protein